MALSPKEQLFLRMSLEKVCTAYFKQLERKKSKILKRDSGPAREDAFAIMSVLSHWAGDIIAAAPPHIDKDQMFLAFADSVIEVAGIKQEGAGEAQQAVAETLQ